MNINKHAERYATPTTNIYPLPRPIGTEYVARDHTGCHICDKKSIAIQHDNPEILMGLIKKYGVMSRSSGYTDRYAFRNSSDTVPMDTITISYHIAAYNNSYTAIRDDAVTRWSYICRVDKPRDSLTAKSKHDLNKLMKLHYPNATYNPGHEHEVEPFDIIYINDIVRFNMPYSPDMRVMDIVEDIAANCVWFTETGEFQEKKFRIVDLLKANGDDG